MRAVTGGTQSEGCADAPHTYMRGVVVQAARGEALGATVALHHPERQGSPHCNRRATSNIIEGNAISFSVIKPWQALELA